jgi:putative exporter of polyketide antibiotics
LYDVVVDDDKNAEASAGVDFDTTADAVSVANADDVVVTGVAVAIIVGIVGGIVIFVFDVLRAPASGGMTAFRSTLSNSTIIFITRTSASATPTPPTVTVRVHRR